MSSTANAVRACVRSDPYLQESLARDIASHAKLARWLLESREIHGSEHAVISALRRMDVVGREDPVDEGREAAGEMELGVEVGYAALVIERTPEALRRSAALPEALGRDATIVPAGDTLTVVVREDEVETAIEVLGREDLRERREDLALVSLDPGPPTGSAAALFGLLHQRLAAHGVTVEASLAASESVRLLVPRGDRRAAREALLEVVDRGRGSDGSDVRR